MFGAGFMKSHFYPFQFCIHVNEEVRAGSFTLSLYIIELPFTCLQTG